MPSSPEILVSIHEVELRLTEARRQADKVRRPFAVQVVAHGGRQRRAAAGGVPADLIVVLTRQLATLWSQYRDMRRA